MALWIALLGSLWTCHEQFACFSKRLEGSRPTPGTSLAFVTHSFGPRLGPVPLGPDIVDAVHARRLCAVSLRQQNLGWKPLFETNAIERRSPPPFRPLTIFHSRPKPRHIKRRFIPPALAETRPPPSI